MNPFCLTALKTFRVYVYVCASDGRPPLFCHPPTQISQNGFSRGDRIRKPRLIDSSLPEDHRANILSKASSAEVRLDPRHQCLPSIQVG